MLRASANRPLDCRHRCFVLASKNWKGQLCFNPYDDVIAGFGAQKYICNNNVATVVYLGTALQKPILVEGPAGVGKTELGKVARRCARHGADSSAVLRGARRSQSPLRMGIRQTAALHADPEGKDRRHSPRFADAAGSCRLRRQSGRRVFLGSIFVAAALAARITVGKTLRFADRRGRQIGRGVRSVSAGNSQRLSNLRAGDRHAQGETYSVRHSNQQQ